MTNNNFEGSKTITEATDSIENKSMIFLEYVNETIGFSEKMIKEISLKHEDSDGNLLVTKDFILKLVEYLRTLSVDSKDFMEEFIDLQGSNKFKESAVAEKLVD